MIYKQQSHYLTYFTHKGFCPRSKLIRIINLATGMQKPKPMHHTIGAECMYYKAKVSRHTSTIQVRAKISFIHRQTVCWISWWCWLHIISLFHSNIQNIASSPSHLFCTNTTTIYRYYNCASKISGCSGFDKVEVCDRLEPIKQIVCHK